MNNTFSSMRSAPAAAPPSKVVLVVIQLQLDIAVQIPVDTHTRVFRLARGRSGTKQTGGEGLVVNVQFGITRHHLQRAPGAGRPVERVLRRHPAKGGVAAGHDPGQQNLPGIVLHFLGSRTKRDVLLGHHVFAEHAERPEVVVELWKRARGRRWRRHRSRTTRKSAARASRRWAGSNCPPHCCRAACRCHTPRRFQFLSGNPSRCS